MSKIYVFPNCAKKEKKIGEMQGISRLFAYPGKPHFRNNGKITVLDSGAWGLSISGGKMDNRYMKKLSKHYNEFGQYRDDILCIAPDEFLNPTQSMMNLRKWFKNNYYTKVTPVIQAESKKNINIDNLKFQVDYYLNFSDTLCFSNNALTGEMAKMFRLEELFLYAKEKGCRWIHVLGAGWSLKDIEDWFSIKYFDSLDSVAYYSTKDMSEFGSLNPIKNLESITSKVNYLNYLNSKEMELLKFE